MSLTFEEGVSLLEDRNYRKLSDRARSIGKVGPEEEETCQRLREKLKEYGPERPHLFRDPSPIRYPLDIISYPIRFFCYWWGPVMDHMQVDIDLDLKSPK